MSNSPSTWRFIPLIQASGQLQMAIDSWLLQQHHLGKHPPTLRFYTWEPVAISLGYHQRHWPQSWQDLTWQAKPIELVRRPTGGRAVLHQGDLTYAVITSGLSTRRIEAYQTICQFLISGWKSLGFELHYGSAGRGYIHNPNCFGTATAADLVLSDGSKLIGSAQLRRDRTILQHGSMRLNLDPDLERQVFGVESPLLEALESRPSQAALCLKSIQIEQIITALVHSARSCFNAELILEPLSQTEWQTIHALREEISDKICLSK